MKEHPITPPPDLIAKWAASMCGYYEAARWGADQELEACREETVDGAGRLYIDDPKLRVRLADDIWTARRPKPPSLKEQALDQLSCIQIDLTRYGMGISVDTIRRALEALPD